MLSFFHIVYQELFGDNAPEIITPWYKAGTNPNVILILSFGATEAKPPEDAEGIIDVTETGTTLIANNLKIIDDVGSSKAYLLANKEALQDPWKKESPCIFKHQKREYIKIP